MIWVRGLFPEENKGQFEGIRVLFFTLIPMLIGTLIGGAIIKGTAQGDPQFDAYGNVVQTPQENLFLIGGLVVLLTLIPLIFATKLYNKRIAQKKAAQALVDAVNNPTAQ
jgi:MFS family permease